MQRDGYVSVKGMKYLKVRVFTNQGGTADNFSIIRPWQLFAEDFFVALERIL